MASVRHKLRMFFRLLDHDRQAPRSSTSGIVRSSRELSSKASQRFFRSDSSAGGDLEFCACYVESCQRCGPVRRLQPVIQSFPEGRLFRSFADGGWLGGGRIILCDGGPRRESITPSGVRFESRLGRPVDFLSGGLTSSTLTGDG